MTPAASRPAASDQAIISCIQAVGHGLGQGCIHQPPPFVVALRTGTKWKKEGEGGTVQYLSQIYNHNLLLTPYQRNNINPPKPPPNPTRTPPGPSNTTPSLPYSTNFCRDRARHRRPRIRRRTASGRPPTPFPRTLHPSPSRPQTQTNHPIHLPADSLGSTAHASFSRPQ